MIYTGLSLDTDSNTAGREAAGTAAAKFNADDSASWVLAFCGGRHKPEVILDGIRSELGDIPIYGGAAVGLITNDTLGNTGYECGLAAFSSEFPVHGSVVVDTLRSGEFQAGTDLGRKLREAAVDGDSVVIFYDNLRSTPPPVLYSGSQLMNGLYEGLEGRQLHIFGAGLVGDFTFSPSFIFDGSNSVRHSAIALILPRALLPHTKIMHGCTPISSFMEITKIEGAVLHELDGKRATDVFSEMLGLDKGSLKEDDIPFLVTLGQKQGDPFAPFSEDIYVNRLIINSDPETGTITLFESDFQQGSKVQIMSRDTHIMLDSVKKQTQHLMNSITTDDAEFAFYIDCAGRASRFCGSETEEAWAASKGIGNMMPFLGFYSGVEIAPFFGRSRPLDWTGVLTIFTRKSRKQSG